MDNPIYMLNALWFKKEGGEEKYAEYSSAIQPIIEEIGAKSGRRFVPEQFFIGEWNPDMFFTVKYPSEQAFEAMVTSDAYKEIAHLREEAIEKSLLIRCSSPD